MVVGDFGVCLSVSYLGQLCVLLMLLSHSPILLQHQPSSRMFPRSQR